MGICGGGRILQVLRPEQRVWVVWILRSKGLPFKLLAKTTAAQKTSAAVGYIHASKDRNKYLYNLSSLRGHLCRHIVKK